MPFLRPIAGLLARCLTAQPSFGSVKKEVRPTELAVKTLGVFSHQTRPYATKPFTFQETTMKATKPIMALAIALLLINSGVSANEKSGAPPSVASSEKTGLGWAKHRVSQYPEIGWLVGDVKATQEGQATQYGYSVEIYGSKEAEFDRTLSSLKALELFIEGGEAAYKCFVAAQPQPDRLPRARFDALHLKVQSLLRSGWGGLSKDAMIQTLTTAVILGDIAKSKKGREIFEEFGVTAYDHDDFYHKTMTVLPEYPDLCPSFARLPEAGRKMLVQIGIGHRGWITHIEGSIGMYTPYVGSAVTLDPIVGIFDVIVHRADVSGARGHCGKGETIDSSQVMTRQTDVAMTAMEKSIAILGDPGKRPQDAYTSYMSFRADLIGLNPQIPLHCVLTRVAAMIRLFTPTEGAIILNALRSLPIAKRASIERQFAALETDTVTPTSTYAPALLVNLRNNKTLGDTDEHRLFYTITIGLPLLERVFALYQQMRAEGGIAPDTRLCFNTLAGVARDNPRLLETAEIGIRTDGEAIIK